MVKIEKNPLSFPFIVFAKLKKSEKIYVSNKNVWSNIPYIITNPVPILLTQALNQSEYKTEPW